MSQATDIGVIKAAVKARNTEAGALSAVGLALGANGWRKQPTVETARDAGGTIHVYTWKGTPFGDLVLVAGPTVQPELFLADELPRASGGGGDYAIKTDRVELGARAGAVLAAAADRGAKFAASTPTPRPSAPPPPPPRAAPAPKPRTPRAPRATLPASVPAPHVAASSSGVDMDQLMAMIGKAVASA